MANKKTKYIFVTGGVLSGLGKGVTAASIGNILKSRGFSVFMQKFDQYLNVDAGTLNPAEHGEVFVTDDGAETDLDLGHYERFVDVSLTRDSSIMSGQIYQALLDKERAGEFLGKTVQVVPHVTDEIKGRIKKAAAESTADILITEIGGTVGDFEGLHFIEAIRQMAHDVGRENVLYVHVGFLPYLEVTEELKTKPLQNSVHDLQAYGISPDVVIARADHLVDEGHLTKIALFTGVDAEGVIPLETVDTIYEVPLILERWDLDKLILKHFNLPLKHRRDTTEWQEMVERIKTDKRKKVTIALVGKYMGMKDTYMSVVEALKAACIFHKVQLNLLWLDSTRIETEGLKILKDADGILVPGGFGSRGIEGKIKAIEYARTKKIPYLGLCYGMQLACVEFARHLLVLKKANTTEIDPTTPDPIIHIMPEQKKRLLGKQYGGSMRLGAYPCVLKEKSLVRKAYGQSQIEERHRHRYEFNNDYREPMERRGLKIVGTSPDDQLVEIIELADHPFFVGTQFHPEFKSRPQRPHPLFREFVKASLVR